MISRISEALKINNLLYLYNEKELNYMLNEIYENLDVNEIDIINFLNNNLIYSSKMINNKYIFTNIFYLYFLSNIKNTGVKNSEVIKSVELFKYENKINVDFILSICPLEHILINSIKEIYDKNGKLIYNKDIYIKQLERNFELQFVNGFLPKEREFSKSVLESYLRIMEKCLEYIKNPVNYKWFNEFV